MSGFVGFASPSTVLRSEAEHARLQDTLAYAYTHGIIMGTKVPTNSSQSPSSPSSSSPSTSDTTIRVQHAPYALYPFRYPRHAFNLATSLALPFNRLMSAICRDPLWIQSVLAETVKADPFTARLLDLMAVVEAERLGQASTTQTGAEAPAPGTYQAVCLGLLRSDYMLHSPHPSPCPNPNPHPDPILTSAPRALLQVEINTIASSFGCISSRVTDMCKTVDPGANPTPTPAPNTYITSDIPDNCAVAGLAAAIHAAHQEWLKQFGDGLSGPVSVPTSAPTPTPNPAPTSSASAVVLMVVQPGEANFCDQRLLHFALKERHNTPCLRATLADIHTHATYPGGKMMFAGAYVSVVYFRAGYQPSDYPTETEWAARRAIERSLAIKCPDIYLHLAGTKKVQQELARPAALERFVGPADCALIRQCFAGLYGLDSRADIDAARALVQRDLAGYVLKPQREGGGNNFFGQQCSDMLHNMPLEELQVGLILP